ncbi:MAG TPA: hypothetical protein VFB58_07895 [Chloroflexota bacterium]|nr:hypothetical protein [Chloroflexota bacterium]
MRGARASPNPVGNASYILTAFALSGVFILIAACAAPSSRSRADTALVLSHAAGICPSHIVYVTGPAFCEFSRVGNVAVGNFRTPHRLWGIAYAFNCGRQPGQFTFAEWLPLMDHMALPGVARYGKHGSGYLMVPAGRWNSFIATIPSYLKFDGDWTAIAVNTTCTFHVVAIRGSRQDVSSSIPPIPVPERPWWRKGHSRT